MNIASDTQYLTDDQIFITVSVGERERGNASAEFSKKSRGIKRTNGMEGSFRRGLEASSLPRLLARGCRARDGRVRYNKRILRVGPAPAIVSVNH